MHSLAGMMFYIIEIYFSVRYRFYQACMYSAILDNHAEGMRDKVIDVLTACSERTSEPALFSPAVSTTFPDTGSLLSSEGVLELRMSLQKPTSGTSCTVKISLVGYDAM